MRRQIAVVMFGVVVAVAVIFALFDERVDVFKDGSHSGRF